METRAPNAPVDGLKGRQMAPLGSNCQQPRSVQLSTCQARLYVVPSVRGDVLAMLRIRHHTISTHAHGRGLYTHYTLTDTVPTDLSSRFVKRARVAASLRFCFAALARSASRVCLSSSARVRLDFCDAVARGGILGANIQYYMAQGCRIIRGRDAGLYRPTRVCMARSHGLVHGHANGVRRRRTESEWQTHCGRADRPPTGHRQSTDGAQTGRRSRL